MSLCKACVLIVPIKIIVLIPNLHNGGAERVTANLVNHWAEKGWQITLVTFASEKTDFYKLHASVERLALGLEGSGGNLISVVYKNLCRIYALRRVLSQRKPDIALSMMALNNILLAFAAKGMPDLAIVGSERTYPPQSPLGYFREWMRYWGYGWFSVITANSSQSAEWLRKHTCARRIEIIPNALTWPLSIQQPCIEPPSWLKKHKILLAVGRLSEEKGFDLLTTVFGQLAGDFPDWVLVILGEGADRDSLEKQIQNASLGGRILLPGHVGNIGRWYEIADLFVMSSRFEGFPNSLVEAMAHGLAPVSFDCDSGPREIIRHEVDGLLVPPGDATAMEGALTRLMQDEALRLQFSDKAKETRKRFSIDKIAAMWEKIFREIRA